MANDKLTIEDVEDALRSSPSWGRIKQIIALHPRGGDLASGIGWLSRQVAMALAGPEPHELLTAAERRATAARIAHLSKALSAELSKVNGGANSSKIWPFWYQAMLDRLALEAALDYRDDIAEHAPESELLALLEDDEEGFHIARYSAYHLLMEGIPELLSCLEIASEQWAAEQPVLAKPNHPNALRLYFIRRMTAYFMHAFGQPMRQLTLAVTEPFFDCGDLSEADLSNLAPVPKRRKSGISLSLVKKNDPAG